MQHVNIATPYDSGTTSTGTPFVVMELVADATNIIQWCDQINATIEQRLPLFGQVCSGIAHAHQRGLLHRDIKPGSILVTLVDEQPAVKVIDFGIARSFTATSGGGVADASVAGSPTFMSPEALGADGNVDLDTRSDIYSLGLLLRELLTGDLPFLPDPSLGALFERLRSGRSIGPAQWLAGQDEVRLKQVAAHRQISPITLQRTIAGDLDAIVRKAMAYERQQRYG
ncbi:MAG: protein kinase [Pseudomonadota bacterium]